MFFYNHLFFFYDCFLMANCKQTVGDYHYLVQRYAIWNTASIFTEYVAENWNLLKSLPKRAAGPKLTTIFCRREESIHFQFHRQNQDFFFPKEIQSGHRQEFPSFLSSRKHSVVPLHEGMSHPGLHKANNQWTDAENHVFLGQ